MAVQAGREWLAPAAATEHGTEQVRVRWGVLTSFRLLAAVPCLAALSNPSLSQVNLSCTHPAAAVHGPRARVPAARV